MPQPPGFPAAPLSIQERVRAALRFYDLGTEELARARGTGDHAREREATEKIFHSLVEALTARVQKYGVGAQTSHEDLVKWLKTKGDSALAELYERTYLTLHVGAYYRGWTTRKEIDERIAEVGRALERVTKELKR